MLQFNYRTTGGHLLEFLSWFAPLQWYLTADKFKDTGASTEDFKTFVDIVEFVETALKIDNTVEIDTAQSDSEYFGATKHTKR